LLGHFSGSQFFLQRDDREPRLHADSTSLPLRAILPFSLRPLARTDDESLPSQHSGAIRSWKTQQADGVSSHPDDRSVQADSRYPGFALQGESNAGSGKPGPAATGQCASPANAEATALQQYGSFSICLALPVMCVGSIRRALMLKPAQMLVRHVGKGIPRLS
jgi:hypothetical protein